MRAAAALLEHQGKIKKTYEEGRFLQGREAVIQQSQMKQSEAISGELDQIGRSVVDCAFTVHRELGLGLLESVYQACFCEELKCRGISFRKQVDLPIKDRTLRVDSG